MMLSSELLLTAYESGYFPMAESVDSKELHWFSPDPRAIIPLDNWRLSRSLRKIIRNQLFTIRVDSAFNNVMRACAAPRGEDRDSWINDDILTHYTILHELGHVHSVECWQDNMLVGGLYGVSCGAAFFGESMFSRVSNASKVAYGYLLEILLACGYTLLDTQFINPHLEQFGVVEVPRSTYLSMLDKALSASPNPSHIFANVGGIIATSDPRDFTVTASPSRSSQ